ncbi:BQ5605_C019g08956 [Microbotryum silenes-dioicae]|uniref:BQ5605_C019g08956 protein n=1 Tax=Microbotryum silenes-dioicae TaxID=796604 RepID=A0A2X0M070_9BASI|nr:BQ5605_C019g08956 [Microbotryum silenes-dioicae]
MEPTPDTPPTAESLAAAHATIEQHKERGNVAFRRGEWDRAVSHYISALELNSDTVLDVQVHANKREDFERGVALFKQRSMLWSNRAASDLHAFRYDLALLSAGMAATCDPDWARPWARRAEALAQLHDFDDAVAAYDEAIKRAPDEPTKTRLCQSRSAVKEHARASLLLSQRPDILYDNPEDSPYGRYQKLVNEDKGLEAVLRVESQLPAAASMADAFDWCQYAVLRLMEQKSEEGFHVIPHQAVSRFAQSLIINPRGFHPPLGASVSAVHDFLETLSLQVRMDLMGDRTADWAGLGPLVTEDQPQPPAQAPYTVEAILEDVEERVSKANGDWTKSVLAIARPRTVLAAYLRTQLVHAWLKDINNNLVEAIYIYEQILNILTTVSTRWAQIPEATQGVSDVFDYTWGRKVRCIYMQALQKAHRQARKWRDGTPISLEDLTVVAEAIIDECASTSGQINPQQDPREFYGYQSMPIASAGAMVGYVLAEKARMRENRRHVGPYWFYHKEMSLAAAKMYAQAAKTLPLDCPERPGFLYCALIYDLRAGVSMTLAELFDRASTAERAYSYTEQIFGPGERNIEPRWAVRLVCQHVRNQIFAMCKRDSAVDFQPFLTMKIDAVPDGIEGEVTETSKLAYTPPRDQIFCYIALHKLDG